MKIPLLNYNLQFGNKPEGKLFIEKYKELFLSIDLLGKEFKYLGDFEAYKHYTYIFTGLKPSILPIIIQNPRFQYRNYDSSVVEVKTYYIQLLAKQDNDQEEKIYSITLDTFKKDFQQI